MASSSTQPASSSSSITSRWKYDVFLSFCGQDTRKGFADHLYAALTRKGILTFRDDEKLPRGEYFSMELLKTIQESIYAVVIISPNYASSKWCLIELTEIIKCERKTRLTILPVFYQVEPHDVRNKKRTFAEAFAEHEQDPRIDMEMIQLWEASLKEVGYISGWHLQERYESTVVEEITTWIFTQLNSRLSRVYRSLVGIDTRAEKMMNLLDVGLDGVRFIGICGMGGIGKTTLAEVVYDKVSYQFEASSFISCVRDKTGKHGLVSLQNQLISEILMTKEIHIRDVRGGINVMGTRMQHRKLFIVLDDVDAETQLEALAGSHDWFGPGSRIIIISRDSHLLKRHVDYLYEIKVLNNDEALKLFSLSAFKKLHPDENYMDLSKGFMKYAQGLPLALKVLGASLFDRKQYAWKSALDQLKANPKKEILDVLEIGFDGLEDLQKKLFLDIACFFKGEVLDNVLMDTLESFGYYPDINIDVLMDKSLITISHFGKLKMHDLLQEMGKEIVRRESPMEPGQRSRLWHYEDVLHVFKNNTGTSAIEGIVLKLPLDKEERLSIGGFKNMKNLRILKLDEIIVAENLWDKLCTMIGHRHPLESISTTELRIMKWNGCPLKSLPTNFQANNLVELSLYGSDNIKELWKGTKSFGSLKLLDLCACKSLIKTPDFTEIPNLEFLDLSGCASLSQVHQSIGVLKRLKELNLSHCVSLESLPLKVLESLEVLTLSGCSSLIKTPNFTKIPNLEFLDLSDCASLSQVHQSIGVLKRLEILNLSRCVSLKSLPLEVLESLKVLNLSGCSSLIKMPNFTEISNLKFLNLSGSTSLSQVHQSIGVLKRLRKLNLSHCVSIKSLPLDMTGLESLKILTLSACTKLEEFPDLSGLKCLAEFKANDTAITKLPSPSLLPKKFEVIEVSGRNDLPPKTGVSCFNGCGTLLEESSHPFRISCLWFYYSPTAHYHQYIWRIFHGSKEIVCERNFLQGLCINCDGEHGGNILYFGLGELLTGLTFVKRKNIFEFLMLGASLATSRISEWFNNKTATCSSPTLKDNLRCEEGSSARQFEVVDIIDFTTRMDHPKLKDNRELKGCSLFFVFEIHGPAWDSQNFQLKHYPPLLPFACIFERNEGNPAEPLFVWAPAVPGVGPIEFWAFVPATWFLEHPNNWDTCNSCIKASVVPPMRSGSCYYYFSGKETKSDISLEEWEDPGVDVKDCRVRLVYKDETPQFYSTVAPHGLHSKFYEQYSVDDPSYHPFETDSDEEAEYLEQYYIDDPRPGETISDEETDSDEEMEKTDSDDETGEVSRLTSTVKFEWHIQRPPSTQASNHATTNWTASVLPLPIHLPSFPSQSPNS